MHECTRNELHYLFQTHLFFSRQNRSIIDDSRFSEVLGAQWAGPVMIQVLIRSRAMPTRSLCTPRNSGKRMYTFIDCKYYLNCKYKNRCTIYICPNDKLTSSCLYFVNRHVYRTSQPRRGRSAAPPPLVNRKRNTPRAAAAAAEGRGLAWVVC